VFHDSSSRQITVLSCYSKTAIASIETHSLGLQLFMIETAMANESSNDTTRKTSDRKKAVPPEKLKIGVKRDLSPFEVDIESLTRGLAIIGQSGSGKSFLLGRFVEELLRVSFEKTRVLIIDTNSDFCQGLSFKTPKKWNDVCDKFKSPEDEDRYVLFKQREDDDLQQLKDLKTKELVIGRRRPFYLDRDLLFDSTRSFCRIARASAMPNDYGIAVDLFRIFKALLVNKGVCKELDWLRPMLHIMAYKRRAITSKQLVDGLPTSASFKENEIATMVDATSIKTCVELLNDLNSLLASGLWTRKSDSITMPSGIVGDHRLVVLEIENIPAQIDRSRTVTMVLDYILRENFLAAESIRNKERIEDDEEPSAVDDSVKRTFIVIDEAQNLAPADPETPHDRQLGELLHRIAAEGRKYGLHLILGTQRPNKLRKGLLGELDNAVIMKMNSRSDLESLASAMRILDVKLLEPALHFFGKGNAIALGEMTGMAPYSVQFKSAPRRTFEGGDDIKGF
jgi:hypothetical protein